MKKSLYTKRIWGLKDYSIDDIVSNYVKAESTYGLYSKSAPVIMPKIQLPNAPMPVCDEPKEEKKTIVKRESSYPVQACPNFAAWQRIKN